MEYIIKTDNFEGPFELLLDLIKKRQMDIYDLHISQITRDYMDKLKEMNENSIEVTSDFMEMASVLLEIKSKLLIPVEPDKEDPRNELVKQLLDYQEYKESLEKMRELKKIEQKHFKRQRTEKLTKKKTGTLADIIKIYQKMLNRKSKVQTEDGRESPLERLKKELARFKYTMEEQMEFLKEQLEHDRIVVEDFFGNMRDKEEMIVTFGALLELIKLQYITIVEDDEVLMIERKVESND